MDKVYLEGTRCVNRCFEIEGIFSAFKFDWDDQFVFKGESHRPWEMVFVRSGKVEVTEDENVYILEKNDLILHAPMEFHAIRSVAHPTSSVLIASFYLEGEAPSELKNGVFSLSENDSREFVEMFEKIYKFRHDIDLNPYSGQETTDLLSAFLIRLGHRTAMERRVISASANEYRRIALAMAHNVNLNLTLSDFARMCNVSVSYIKLLFKKYATLSPKTYYANLRTQHAISLMRQGKSALEISSEMNFSSPNYFSAFFKKQTGAPPSDYRKRLK